MKFVVKQTGLVESTREINVRNVAATIANLRAAIAVHFKVDPSSFRMSHPTVSLDNERTLVTESGLKDGDTITLTTKRDRDDDEPPTAAAASSVAPQAPAPPPPATPAFPYEAALQTLLNMGFAPEPSRAALVASNGDVQIATRNLLTPAAATNNGARRTAPHLVHPHDGEDDDEWADEEGEEGDELEEDDEEFDEEGEEEEEMDEEQQEQAQLVLGLMGLPNAPELREQFMTQPQEVLRTIQRENPDLFRLIGRHNQFFLDLVQNGDVMRGEEGDDEEDDGDFEYDEGSGIGIGAGVWPGQQPQAGARGSAGVPPPPAAQNGAGAPQLTPQDAANIESLMLLGFTREQCTAAYFRCGRNVERAGNLLFENPPGL